MQFVDIDEQFPAVTVTPEDPQLISQRAVDDALVVHVGSYNEPEAANPDVITVAVSPEDAEVLTWAVEARLPIAFLPADVSEMNLRFGEDISLLAFSANPQEDRFEITLYWLAGRQPAEDYQVFVNFMNESREVIAQSDVSLQDAQGNLSSQWQGSPLVVSTYTITFDQPLEPEGVYIIGVGLYRASDGSRVPIVTSDPTVGVKDDAVLLYAFSPS